MSVDAMCRDPIWSISQLLGLHAFACKELGSGRCSVGRRATQAVRGEHRVILVERHARTMAGSDDGTGQRFSSNMPFLMSKEALPFQNLPPTLEDLGIDEDTVNKFEQYDDKTLIQWRAMYGATEIAIPRRAS